MWKIILLSCVALHCAYASLSVKSTDAKEVKYPTSLVWDGTSNYYIDFDSDSTQKCLYRYDTSNGKTYSASVKGSNLGAPSFIVPAEGSSDKLRKFVVGWNDIVTTVYWDGKSDRAEVGKELLDLSDRFGPKERVGFGHRDISGRTLYIGTLDNRFCGPSANQSVYKRLRGDDYEQVIQNRVLRRQKLPNGWAFANGKVYILDSCALKIYEIADSKCKGACIGRDRVVFDFKDLGKKSGKFFPSGLEADSYGNLYTVSYYTGSVYKIRPEKGTAEKIASSPSGGTTSVSFGGKDLYITVAKYIIDVYTGRTISKQNPGTSLYVIKNLEKSPSFKRYKA